MKVDTREIATELGEAFKKSQAEADRKVLNEVSELCRRYSADKVAAALVLHITENKTQAILKAKTETDIYNAVKDMLSKLN